MRNFHGSQRISLRAISFEVSGWRSDQCPLAQRDHLLQSACRALQGAGQLSDHDVDAKAVKSGVVGVDAPATNGAEAAAPASKEGKFGGVRDSCKVKYHLLQFCG